MSSRCRREMKLEWPMFTSTWPRLELRPMMTRFCRIRYSKSRPSSRAIATGDGSCAHCTLEGDGGADLSESSAQASLSELRENWVWAMARAGRTFHQACRTPLATRAPTRGRITRTDQPPPRTHPDIRNLPNLCPLYNLRLLTGRTCANFLLVR